MTNYCIFVFPEIQMVRFSPTGPHTRWTTGSSSNGEHQTTSGSTRLSDQNTATSGGKWRDENLENGMLRNWNKIFSNQQYNTQTQNAVVEKYALCVT